MPGGIGRSLVEGNGTQSDKVTEAQNGVAGTRMGMRLRQVGDAGEEANRVAGKVVG